MPTTEPQCAHATMKYISILTSDFEIICSKYGKNIVISCTHCKQQNKLVWWEIHLSDIFFTAAQ